MRTVAQLSKIKHMTPFSNNCYCDKFPDDYLKKNEIAISYIVSYLLCEALKMRSMR